MRFSARVVHWPTTLIDNDEREDYYPSLKKLERRVPGSSQMSYCIHDGGLVCPEDIASSVIALPVMSRLGRDLMGEFEAPKTVCDKCDQVRVNPFGI